MNGYEVVSIGDISATDYDSVYVGFDVSPDQRTAIATIASENVDLQAVPEHTVIGQAYELKNGDVAVQVHEHSALEYGYD